MSKDNRQGTVVVKPCKDKDGVLVARYYAPETSRATLLIVGGR